MHLDSTRTMDGTRLAPPANFTEAMSRLASGVVMVTSWLDGRPWGMTVSSFASISLEPPTILVSLAAQTASARTIESGGRFGISILGRQHVAAARYGATAGTAKFIEDFTDGHTAGFSPSVSGALAHLDCELAERVSVADHTIFVGLVRDVRIGTGGEPLVYFRRGYRRLATRNDHTQTQRRTPCLTS